VWTNDGESDQGDKEGLKIDDLQALFLQGASLVAEPMLRIFTGQLRLPATSVFA
jgi:hypothetical protein